MRKIKFDDETINAIKDYLSEGHTIKETCNRFTLKRDTLKRVMFEHNLSTSNKLYSDLPDNIDAETENLVCNLFEFTDTSMHDIAIISKLKDYKVQYILRQHFTEEFISKRKARLYRNSKLGDKNPMKGKVGDKNPFYKGIIEDGKGYNIVLKPEWYTGRVGSRHVFLHHVVMAEALGLTEIPKGFVVHHIDGNKKNNDINNLALVNLSGHCRWHSIIKNIMQGAETIRNGVGVISKTPDNS